MSSITKKYKIGIIYENPLVPDGIKQEATLTYSGGIKAGTRGMLKGLTETEEEYLLPPIIGCSANDNAFRERCDEYWSNFGVIVPYDGLDIDASYTVKNSKNVPTNLEHYIIANMMLNDDNVAVDNPTAYGYKFYIVDIAAQEQAKLTTFQTAKEANIYLAKLLADESETNTQMFRDILVFYKEKLGKSLFELKTMNRLQLEMDVATFATAEPERFMKIAKNETLSQRAFIKKLEEAGVIEKLGEFYFDKTEKLGTQSQFANALKEDAELQERYNSVLLEMNK